MAKTVLHMEDSAIEVSSLRFLFKQLDLYQEEQKALQKKYKRNGRNRVEKVDGKKEGFKVKKLSPDQLEKMRKNPIVF